MKDVKFHPVAQDELRGFPKSVRDRFGYSIFRLQMGDSLGMPLAKPVKSIGKGVMELRIKDEDGIYRAFYYLKVEDKILVFHVFKKKTQKIPKKELDLGAKRFRELLDGKI